MSNVTIKITGTGRIINLKKENKIPENPLLTYIKELYERENRNYEIAKRRFEGFKKQLDNASKRYLLREYDTERMNCYFIEMTTLSRIVRSLKNKIDDMEEKTNG